MTCGKPSHIRKWFGPCSLSYGHSGGCEHPPLDELYASDGRCSKCGNDRAAWDRAVAEIARLTAELAAARSVPGDVEELVTMPTDLRAALRDAAEMLARVKPIDLRVSDDPHGLAARCRDLADAPTTVAELLPMVDATHEVHWEAHGEERRAYAPDGGAIAVEYRTGRMRWMEAHLTVFDLRRPATLVEVSP